MNNNPIATANATAITTGVVYLACRFLVIGAPDFMFSIAQSWFHGIALTKMDTWSVSTETLLLGFVSSVAFAWIIGYLYSSIRRLMKS